MRPGTLARLYAKHYECYAATEAAGPLRPQKTIGTLKSPPDM